MAGSATVEDYLSALPEKERSVLLELHATIRAAAPGATEGIAYEMPAFRQGGRFLVSYAAFKRHYSLFPASEAVVVALGDEVRPYLAGMGTIRFPAASPIPLDLVRRIVEIRVAEVAKERA